jgi:hypothetical protein
VRGLIALAVTESVSFLKMEALMNTSIRYPNQYDGIAKIEYAGVRARACHVLATAVLILSVAPNARAMQSKDAPIDITGTYSCVGHDEHLGDFKERHEIRPNEHHALHSRGYSIAAYVQDQLAYSGEAIVEGRRVAVNFASATDSGDHGVLLGTIVSKAPVIVKGEYFESQFKGGDSGSAICTQTAK